MASQMMPISPQKCVQTQIQHLMGAGKLEFRDMIPNISNARPFIHVKITSSKIRIHNNSKHQQRQLTYNLKEEKNFLYVVNKFKLQSNYKIFKTKGKLVKKLNWKQITKIGQGCYFFNVVLSTSSEGRAGLSSGLWETSPSWEG